MDYNELTKDEVINKLNENKISYSSSKSKNDLIDLLIEFENKKSGVSEGISRKSATTVSIVGLSLMIPLWIILCIFIIGIPFLIGDIIAIVINVKYKKTGNMKVSSGVLAIIFGSILGIIGGILTFLSK